MTVIDWLADYYERVESFPVSSQVEPGETLEIFPLDNLGDGLYSPP